jgi:rhodanese-related sulfurtransferase
MTKLKSLFVAVLAMTLVAGLSGCNPVKLDVSGVAAIIDTRSAEEFAKSHIVGAINNPYASGDFMANSTHLASKAKYFIYGTNEEEVSQACQILFKRGFTDVTNLGDFENAKRILPLGVTP